MEREKNIALEFDDFSKNYTNDMIGCVPHYLQLVSSFEKHLPKNFKPNSILDLGCGNGNITAQLIPSFPNAAYTLVDASIQMIDLCRNKFKNYNITYSNKYFKDFIFNSGSYDLIVAGFSLHHCDNLEKQSTFKKIYAALKKGGIFAYCDLMINKTNPDHSLLLEEWRKFVSKSFPDGEKWTWMQEHYEAFDKPSDYQEQLAWLKSAGFQNIQILFNKEYWVYLQATK